jgi:hypothetical protein
VKNALSGFECTYASDYMIEFENDSYESIEYYCLEDVDLAEQVEEDANLYSEYYSDYMIDTQKALTKEVNGVTITYSVFTMNMYDTNMVDYFFYRQLPNGGIVEAEVYTYPDDSNLSVDDLLQLLSDDFLQIN